MCAHTDCQIHTSVILHGYYQTSWVSRRSSPSIDFFAFMNNYFLVHFPKISELRLHFLALLGVYSVYVRHMRLVLRDYLMNIFLIKNLNFCQKCLNNASIFPSTQNCFAGRMFDTLILRDYHNVMRLVKRQRDPLVMMQ